MTTPRVPILMYHKVGASTADSIDKFVNVSPANFERHMRAMSKLGFKALTFADAIAGLADIKRLPRRSFAITFDDGYACVGKHAVPILQKYGFPATVFVVSDGVGRTNEWDRMGGKPVIPLMGWSELRELQACGWEIGGHTRSHPQMDLLPRSEALSELIEGKQIVQEEVGIEPQTFCYPYGLFNSETPALVRMAGFTGACTTQSGIAVPGLNSYLIPRVKPSHSDGIAGLLYKLHIRPHMPTFERNRKRVGW